MFPLFVENKLTATNQLGFKLGESCNNQLIPISHKIYQLNDVPAEVQDQALITVENEFYPDISKQAQDVIFSHSMQKGMNLPLKNYPLHSNPPFIGQASLEIMGRPKSKGNNKAIFYPTKLDPP